MLPTNLPNIKIKIYRLKTALKNYQLKTVKIYQIKAMEIYRLKAVYSNIINKVDFNKLVCPHCGKEGVLIRHAYYERWMNNGGKKVKINILRVKCKHCKTTHAVLPPFLIPYRQIITELALEILDKQDKIDSILADNLLIEKNQITSIINIYNKHFSSISISTLKKSSLSEICTTSLNKFKCMFLQVRGSIKFF
jgi:hypothetical protein